MAAGILVGPAGAFIVLPIWAGFMVSMLGDDPSRVRGNDHSLNGFKLVGDARDLSQIKAMQEYIDKKTDKLKHMGRLPDALEAHLQRHIADVAPVLQRVRVYHAYAWGEKEKGELSSFEFQRKFIDEKGAEASQTMAKVELVPMGLLPRSEPARLIVEQIAAKQPMQALPAPDALTGEFKALADKVEGVVERVGALEQPAPTILEKPKFRGNNRG
ncbi:MAG: hypothetical protein Q8K65_09650 [Alphaproteobacteria bacterium]|nr:hypothetical protein [Alphaproteobacteria bacterium]